jgi:hypothetical protein
MIRNFEVFQRNPLKSRLVNDGTARVNEPSSQKEIDTLRYEVEHFVCKGQYRDGMIRILESYLASIDAAVQPAAWVSGFYGSGKSHLLKMFRYFWVNYEFDDGATARGLAHLPAEVTDLFRELDTLGTRHAGLHAASATLPSGGGENVRLAILKVLNKSCGYPEALPQAKLCLWLKNNQFYEAVRTEVEQAGRIFEAELQDMYVSPTLAKALYKVHPTFAPDEKQILSLIKTQFPLITDVSTSEFISHIRNILETPQGLPHTVLVLDEIQLYIGTDPGRAVEVQEATEALCKQLDSRMLLIGAGQTALAGNVPLLQKLKGRFTINVELADTDVQTVTRQVVLAKKADKIQAIEDALTEHSGEIDRQLSGTKIASQSDDKKIRVADYPLLPVRRRFWENVLRAVDEPGTSSQLRTQLRIVHEAVHSLANDKLGTVVPADYVFEQLRPDLIRSNVLLREIDELIKMMDDGTEDGRLAQRICSLIFLIKKLPRDASVDIGVRATADMIADLMISDLSEDGNALRMQIPKILDTLVEKTVLIKIDNEYGLQTRESSEWEKEFRTRRTKLMQDPSAVGARRSDLLKSRCEDLLGQRKFPQGKAKEVRRLALFFGESRPPSEGRDVPIIIRNGWDSKETETLADARQDGNESPNVYVFIPRLSADDLRDRMVDALAAEQTLAFKGAPASPEGREARDAMDTRLAHATARRNEIIKDILDRAKVFQSGGNESFGVDLVAKVEQAVSASMLRMFPNFTEADDDRWARVITQAKGGDETPLRVLGWTEPMPAHPVCKRVMQSIGNGKSGKEIRDEFEASPYGWPRDAVDGALLSLFAAGHIQASYKGKPLAKKELDQAKVSQTDFRLEDKPFSALQRIQLRKLLQECGVQLTGDDSANTVSFLQMMKGLAGDAGGPPPLPNCPYTDTIETLLGLQSNEQLTEVLDKQEELRQSYSHWTELLKLKTERYTQWIDIGFLASFAKGLEGISEIDAQISSVESHRNLLIPNSPLPAIDAALSSLLRQKLNHARKVCQTCYDEQMEFLLQDDNWNVLEEAKRTQLLKTFDIEGIPAIDVQSSGAILKSLQRFSLQSWNTLLQAIPHRFMQVRLEAARLLEPATQHVTLQSSVLKTEADVHAWFEAETVRVLDLISKGPVIIG